ncbi:MAG TPA: hypothetical protein VGO35_10055 [Gammaproteobacteria bacterium]|jgi:predicted transcriptional regulator|nr:hypothetical protein [Gammaproteobacteria bacterium]
MNRDFFENKSDLRIVRVDEYDASVRSDNWLALRLKILTCEEMYPTIDKWLDKKVIKGMETGERVGYIGFLDDKPVATAIVKRGENAKFCHLKIDEELQNNGLGDVFFSLMAIEVRDLAKSVHFTLPESLWESKQSFFKSFSFDQAVTCSHQYRSSEKELWSEASYKDVYRNMVSKFKEFGGIASIAGYSMESQLVMSIQPKYAAQIMLGIKIVEIRKKFSKRWEDVRLNIYASAPDKSLVGEAKIAKVIEGSPEKIWENFETMIGGTKEEFDAYTKGLQTAFAIVLTDVKPYARPVPLQQINELVGRNLVVPQSYSIVGRDQYWRTAISMAAVLQSNAKKKKVAVRKVV